MDEQEEILDQRYHFIMQRTLVVLILSKVPFQLKKSHLMILQNNFSQMVEMGGPIDVEKSQPRQALNCFS